MYAVTSTYKDKIKENNRVFAIEIVINHSGGTLTLTDTDIVEGSVLYTQKSQNGNDFACGGVVSNTLDFAIIRKPEYNAIDFTGAKVTAQVGLLLAEGYDEYTAFLNPNTPSYYPEVADQFEWVPLGSFNVDIVTKLMTTMELKCADNMINLDESYSQSLLSYPATLEQIYFEICTFGDVSAVTTSFPNDSYTVPTKPTGEYSYRDILAWVAELSGTFAHINRSNGLELKWYGSTSVESYDGNHRFDYKVNEHTVQITGISYSTEDTVYLTGTDDYVLDLSNNLLLQDNYATVLPNILSNVGGLIFNPFVSNWQGNPALDVGDLVTHTASDTTVYIQPLTILKYKYRGKCYMGGEGQSQSEHNYKGSTDKRLEIIKKQIEDSIGNQLTDLEQAIVDATDLITSELGGYVLKRENELLIMDNPDPNLAVKVWRWNLGGLGYSTTGVNGTYGTAITMNGAIVANYITTGTLSADRVRTGLITSEDSSSWINLDNGSFNFKNQIVWSSLNSRVELGSGTLLVAPSISGGNIAIGSANNVFKADSNGIYLGNAVFSSARFRVDMAGNLTATNATLSGNISATSLTAGASISAPTITGGSITGTSIKSNSTISVTTNATIGRNLYMDSNTLGDGIYFDTNYETSITVADPSKGVLITGGLEIDGGLWVSEISASDIYVSNDIKSNRLEAYDVYPPSNNSGTIGYSNYRWNVGYFKTVNYVTLTPSSDMRLKENIITIDDNLINAVDKLQFKQFNFIQDIDEYSLIHYGMIAQDVIETLSNNNIDYINTTLVGEYFDENSQEKRYSINYNELLLLKIIALEKRIHELEVS